ncbi:MAG: gliding motility protein GldN [Muribaculaceae bacterium]|nr:gliding motility protein GldN [Muribaculaceae bacterium]
MKLKFNILRNSIAVLAIAGTALFADAQATDSSSSSIRRGSRESREAASGPQVTQRMQQFFQDDASQNDASMQWMRIIYRTLDLEDPANSALYFPEEAVEGEENLFRLIMHLLADGKIQAYYYVDGRENFTDRNRLNVAETLDRFYIPYTQAKGSTEKNPRYEIQDDDIPSYEILSYYIIERWTFDTRTNRKEVKVEAICPVLHRAGDFGSEAMKYPMFWVRMEPLRPYLASQDIFIDDDNNLAKYTYDDFFAMNLYKGDIYKTRNHSGKSLMQLYPTPEALEHARDSIQKRLDSYDANLWVPTREELIAAREAREAAENGTVDEDATEKAPKARVPRRNPRNKQSKPKVQKEPKAPKASSGNAVRSVRRRK